jgi:endonuclease YncB( thermonuclease family)
MPPKHTSSTCAMSRKKRNIILLLSLLLLALLVLLDNTLIKHKWQSQPKSEEQAKTYDLEKYHAKNFAVIHVIDGDTLDIDIPDGQSGYTRIRLLGIDAPEKTAASDEMYFSSEATEFAKKIALGKQVEVFLDEATETRGKYGRLLAYVKLPDGKFLNELLLSEGFAYADLRFGHSFYNKYKQIESRARNSKKGLWKNVTPIQMPLWLRERERQ